MSAIKSDFSIQSFLERSELVREIQAECNGAERGEQVDLKQTTEKLRALVQKLNADIRAIKLAPKMSLNVRQAYDLHRAELKDLTARVNSLTVKTNGIPAWVKPVVSAAFVLAGVAATAFILYKSEIFSSQTSPSSTPVPTGIKKPNLDTALKPLGKGTSFQEYRSQGAAIFAQLKCLQTESGFFETCLKMLPTKTNLSNMETQYFYNQCIASVISEAAQKECSEIDELTQVAESVQPYGDSNGKFVDDSSVGHEIARYPLAFPEGYSLPHFILSPPILSDAGSFVKDVLFATPSQILNILFFAGRQVAEAGQSLGKRWDNDSYIGHALQFYPRTTLVATGTASGTGIGVLRRAYYVFKAAIEADLDAALNVIKPEGKLTRTQKRNFNYRKARASFKAFDQAVSAGTFAMASLYMIGGSALVGAVAVPVVAGGVYGVYSLYTYFIAPATNATQSEEKLLA